MSYEVVNAHWKRRCHPETCCCSTEYVIVQDGFITDNVDTVEEGEALIKWCIENKCIEPDTKE